MRSVWFTVPRLFLLARCRAWERIHRRNIHWQVCFLRVRLKELKDDSQQDSLAAKGLLRHSSVTTTERHYIKDVPENTLRAMNQLEKLFNDCSTVKN
jgi:hypothetical protein